MDVTFISIFLSASLISISCFVIAYLIVVKQKRNLINSWDDSAFSNPQKAAQIIGVSIVILGISVLLSAIAWGASLISFVSALFIAGLSVSLPLIGEFIAELMYSNKRS